MGRCKFWVGRRVLGVYINCTELRLDSRHTTRPILEAQELAHPFLDHGLVVA